MAKSRAWFVFLMAKGFPFLRNDTGPTPFHNLIPNRSVLPLCTFVLTLVSFVVQAVYLKRQIKELQIGAVKPTIGSNITFSFSLTVPVCLGPWRVWRGTGTPGWKRVIHLCQSITQGFYTRSHRTRFTSFVTKTKCQYDNSSQAIIWGRAWTQISRV